MVDSIAIPSDKGRILRKIEKKYHLRQPVEKLVPVFPSTGHQLP